MSSAPPPRPVTPYEKFTDAPRSITPLSMQAVSEAPPASARSSTFTKEIRDALDLIEQSILHNVKNALQKLGSVVIAKQSEQRVLLEVHESRLTAHAVELRTLRGAVERLAGSVILPPPPDGL